MPVLVYADAGGKAHPVPMSDTKPRLTIGRSVENDVALSFDNLVSRAHAAIEKRKDEYWIVDLKSRFGTFVNGERLESGAERRLLLGDKMMFANTSAAFMEAYEAPSENSEPSVNVFSTGSEENMGQMLHDAKRLAIRLSALVTNPQEATSNPERSQQMATNLIDRIAATEERFKEIARTQSLNNTLSEVGKFVNQITDLGRVLRLTMDMAVKALEAERGFILLRDGDGGIRVRISHNMGIEDHAFSTSIARKALEEGAPVLTIDAMVDERFKEQSSIQLNAIRAVMCVPMRNKESKVIGAIFVDGRQNNPLFSDKGMEFLTGFASQAAVSIENAQLEERSKQETEKRQRLSRYFSGAVLDDIMSGSEDAMGGRSKTITCLFTDVRGFTSLSEQLSPAEVVEMLNEYFSEIVDDLYSEAGTLDKYTGDGIMAFWNAPREQPDHARRAVRAALKMQERMPAMLARWTQEGRSFMRAASALSTGIGIHTGEAIVGNIGSLKRMEFTAIGDAVNLTARVCGVADGGAVLVTTETLRAIGPGVQATALPAVALKGKKAAVPVFSVEGLTEPPRRG